MITGINELETALFIMMEVEKKTAELFSKAAEKVNDPKLKKLFKELEQCSRNHHSQIYDFRKHKTWNEHWVEKMLCLEIESHSFYNRMAAQAADPSARQLFKQLRDSKMRSITLLQEELKQQKKK